MIFKKQRATIRKCQLWFVGQVIEVVKQYTYLGFTFIPSGKKHKGTENLKNKAKKSWFILQRFLSKPDEKIVKTYLKLTNTTIKPVALYDYESWGTTKTKIT